MKYSAKKKSSELTLKKFKKQTELSEELTTVDSPIDQSLPTSNEPVNPQQSGASIEAKTSDNSTSTSLTWLLGGLAVIGGGVALASNSKETLVPVDNSQPTPADPTPPHVAPLIPSTGSSILIADNLSETLQLPHFPFEDKDGDAVRYVIIEKVPLYGILMLNGAVVTNGQAIPAEEITAGHLIYDPAGAETSCVIEYRIQDTGASEQDTNTISNTGNLVIHIFPDHNYDDDYINIDPASGVITFDADSNTWFFDSQTHAGSVSVQSYLDTLHIPSAVVDMIKQMIPHDNSGLLESRETDWYVSFDITPNDDQTASVKVTRLGVHSGGEIASFDINANGIVTNEDGWAMVDHTYIDNFSDKQFTHVFNYLSNSNELIVDNITYTAPTSVDELAYDLQNSIAVSGTKPYDLDGNFALPEYLLNDILGHISESKDFKLALSISSKDDIPEGQAIEVFSAELTHAVFYDSSYTTLSSYTINNSSLEILNLFPVAEASIL